MKFLINCINYRIYHISQLLADFGGVAFSLYLVGYFFSSFFMSINQKIFEAKFISNIFCYDRMKNLPNNVIDNSTSIIKENEYNF